VPWQVPRPEAGHGASSRLLRIAPTIGIRCCRPLLSGVFVIEYHFDLLFPLRRRQEHRAPLRQHASEKESFIFRRQGPKASAASSRVRAPETHLGDQHCDLMHHRKRMLPVTNSCIAPLCSERPLRRLFSSAHHPLTPGLKSRVVRIIALERGRECTSNSTAVARKVSQPVHALLYPSH